MTRRRVKLAAALFVLAVAALFVGSATRQDPQPYVAVADALPWPADWRLVHEEVVGDWCMAVMNPGCPSVTRYYALPDDLRGDLASAIESTRAAGFVEIDTATDHCDFHDNGGLRCGFTGRNGRIHIQVNLYASGFDVDGKLGAQAASPIARVFVN